MLALPVLQVLQVQQALLAIQAQLDRLVQQGLLAVLLGLQGLLERQVLQVFPVQMALQALRGI